MIILTVTHHHYGRTSNPQEGKEETKEEQEIVVRNPRVRQLADAGISFEKTKKYASLTLLWQKKQD